MDIPSIQQKLALLDVGGFDSSLRGMDAALFNAFDGTFKKSLSIEDTKSSECNRNANCDDNSNDKNNKQKELELTKNSSSKKCLSKSKSFPFPAVTSHPNDFSDIDNNSQTAMGDVFSNESMHQAFARSVSLPAPMKLVPAMKGSRAQHYGTSPKLSVKWAPDVYDPPQTSLSHNVKNNKKQPKSKNRKNGKKGQKGSNYSHGSGGGRDKRKSRKAGGSSDRYQRSFDEGSSDSHCGSIFLKTSVTKVHYSVTEAL